jgi:flavin-dependent dehydrogenase
LTLLRYTRHRVVLFEASNYDGFRVGETVSSALCPLLDYLGAGSILDGTASIPAYGSAAAWGSETLSERDFIFSGRGQGLHLDRRAFDRGLIACIEPMGGTVRLGERVTRIARADAGWTVSGKSPSPLTAQIVIDATGRSSGIARRIGAVRTQSDRLVGIACHLTLMDKPPPATTLVEAMPDGWWYSAPLPNGMAVAAFMTDADLVRGLNLDTVEGFMRRCRATRHTAARLAGAQPSQAPRTFPADSHSLTPSCGDGWVAAGDAVCAFDPLASLGIGYALSSGIQAARIADGWLRGDDELARAYAADVARHVAVYRAQSREIYAGETRWPAEPFWARRQSAPRT